MDSRIERILKHPAVSRAMAPLESNDPRVPEWRTPGLKKLLKLRKARSDVKRAAANLKDEIQAGHAGYDGGGIVEVPKMPGHRLLREALEAGGLPDDLRLLIEEELAGGVQ